MRKTLVSLTLLLVLLFVAAASAMAAPTKEMCAKPDYWYKCNKTVANYENGVKDGKCTPNMYVCYCTRKCMNCLYVASMKTNIHKCYTQHYSPCTKGKVNNCTLS